MRPAASSKILVRYSAWRSGPTVSPEGWPPDAQPTSVIQIGFDPSPARSSRPRSCSVAAMARSGSAAYGCTAASSKSFAAPSR